MSRERRKARVGRVVSDKMDKTIVVAYRWQQRNRLYGKAQRRITKFYAHDGDNACSLGDLVRVEETRPISRLKNWRVVDILERREVAEVKPVELDREIMESQTRGQSAALAAEEAAAQEQAAPEDDAGEVPSPEAESGPATGESEEAAEK